MATRQQIASRLATSDKLAKAFLANPTSANYYAFANNQVPYLPTRLAGARY